MPFTILRAADISISQALYVNVDIEQSCSISTLYKISLKHNFIYWEFHMKEHLLSQVTLLRSINNQKIK